MADRHLIDRAIAAVVLVAASPLLLAAALGIAASSPGPVLYRARRAGLGGRDFTMYKFRTMHVNATGAAITAGRDPRVFAFGALLRRLKIDELPQLWNIVRGEMAIVGPRPEDPRLVAEHYTAEQWRTLDVLPGLTSPGSLYNYTHGDALLQGEDPERAYVERLLPVKLGLEQAYVRRASFAYDAALVLRTVAIIAQIAAGRRRFPDPPEMAEARRLARRSPAESERPVPRVDERSRTVGSLPPSQHASLRADGGPPSRDRT